MEYHVPVLVEPVMAALLTDLSESAIYVDGTLGGGNHTMQILSRTAARVIGIDRDAEAIEAAKARIGENGRLTVVWGNHDDLGTHLDALDITEVSGVLLDLGASSHQFDESSRGFSYNTKSVLDMRMDRSRGKTAMDVVNAYSHGELTRVIREYGEDKWASRIAAFIIKARPIETTTQLVDCVCAAIPASARRTGPHPARRTFQAIRIEVNGELSRLAATLESAINYLKPGGRLCVITFHSLEDRIVKQTFLRLQNPCVCPPKSPVCVCGMVSTGRTRGSVTPGDAELLNNPRSRSARLRVFEKKDGE